MYSIITTLQEAFNGQKVLAHYRNDTSDYNTLISILAHDEYHVQKFDIQDGDVIIDIGSHIGAFPLLLSALGKKVGVYCYEPIPENYNLLFKNLEDNNLQDFGYCFQKAVAGKSDKKVKIYYGDDSFDGLAHKFIGTPIFSDLPDKEKNLCEAETITLDEIFEQNKISACKLIKIDCEGFEYEIFEHASDETLDKIEFIVGEHHGNVFTGGVHPRAHLLQLLRNKFDDISLEKSTSSQDEFIFKHK